MCVVLKSDVIVASTVKRLNNFYSVLMRTRFAEGETVSEVDYLPEYRISIQDCINRQRDAHFSSLGVVVADSDYSDFETFLEGKNDTFVRCGYDCYTLTEKAKNYCLSNNINGLMNDIIDNAYSKSTLMALDII